MKESTRVKYNRHLHSVEKGFTLIELLIVIAVLGILAAVIVPNVVSFIRSGNKAAANGEVATVNTALQGYYSDFGNYTGPTTNASAMIQAGNTTSYISPYLGANSATKGSYNVSATGTLNSTTSVNGTDSWKAAGLSWNITTQAWQ